MILQVNHLQRLSGSNSKIRTKEGEHKKMFAFFIDTILLTCYYEYAIIIQSIIRRIVLGIWPKSFYQAAVNGLTTMWKSTRLLVLVNAGSLNQILSLLVLSSFVHSGNEAFLLSKTCIP